MPRLRLFEHGNVGNFSQLVFATCEVKHASQQRVRAIYDGSPGAFSLTLTNEVAHVIGVYAGERAHRVVVIEVSQAADGLFPVRSRYERRAPLRFIIRKQRGACFFVPIPLRLLCRTNPETCLTDAACEQTR